MKSKLLFCVIAALFAVFVSCSKEDEAKINNPQLLADYEPYISPELQRMFDMAEASTEPIPIEELIPNIEELLSTDAQPVNDEIPTRAVGDYLIIKGCDNMSITKYKAATSINALQAKNLGFPTPDGNPVTGIYYITVYIATHNILDPEGTPDPIILKNVDVLGIKPNLNEIGYSVQTLIPNVYYKCTTYLFAIHKTNNSGQPLEEIFYVIPGDNVPTAYSRRPEYVLNNLLTWRYMIY